MNKTKCQQETRERNVGPSVVTVQGWSKGRSGLKQRCVYSARVSLCRSAPSFSQNCIIFSVLSTHTSRIYWNLSQLLCNNLIVPRQGLVFHGTQVFRRPRRSPVFQKNFRTLRDNQSKNIIFTKLTCYRDVISRVVMSLRSPEIQAGCMCCRCSDTWQVLCNVYNLVKVGW